MAALRRRSPAAQPGQGCRPGGAARLRLFAPPPRPAVAAPARHRRAGSWGLRAAFIPAPARPRAPRPPPAAGPRQQLRPCQKAVYCILCSRRRPLPVANAAGKRSARSPQKRNRTSNGGIQLRGKKFFYLALGEGRAGEATLKNDIV